MRTFTRVAGAAWQGAGARLVDVQISVADVEDTGRSTFRMVGLPDSAMREGRDRVQGALRHGGWPWPVANVTVNLAPAAARKQGPALDLPIALGLLAAQGSLLPGGARGADHEPGTGVGRVARKALSAVRVTETEGSAGANRIATFFANQLGARSVSPREGDDADAILSRAEAALRSGDLSAALSELSSMPDVAQSALADWQNSAQTRLEAKTAADALVQQLLQ